ncbi:TonB-dependent siderophore receptor [Pseudomonas multiresinivorans]|uniref:TonB-dependent siderophore receptor n=1 Tax=Pseudomonas multiresinivorans TaxID=95301 RepID=A0A7Z3BKX6_9PSED|nr:TonB-dependent siderophore receptor [Pseudomonas multiresinivorans]QJP08784.1 TonB-dependent siderophore receptor [Pseudomonas multiresinivorans]
MQYLPRPARTRFPLSLLTLAVLLASGPGHAEDATTLDTVTVIGHDTESYASGRASVGGFGEAPLLDTPASISVFNQALLKDQQARLLSDVLKNDASTGEAYAPVGYYENFEIRGYSLNAASSYKINGRTITGEQNVALENKEQVEVLKGLSGLQSGVSEPGGVINYVTKRPQDVRSVTLGTDDEGGRYVATDVGAWLDNEQTIGVRVNLAHDDLRSYIDHTDGQRDFASLALDWNLSPNALWQFDAEYQNRRQPSAPGYQLLGGTELPHDIDPHDRIGYQSWADPVRIESLNLNTRFEYRFDDAWTGTLSASRSRVVIDDYSAFPWGCYGAASCADSAVPNYFSPEGDYDLYDFRSPDDTRRNDELEAALHGQFATGWLRHELTVGTSAFRRVLDSRPELNEWVGTGNIYTGIGAVEPFDGEPGHSYRHLDSRQYGLFASDRISLNDQWQVVLGGRQVRLDERTFDSEGDTTRHTRRAEFLPNGAVIFKPRADISIYGSYSKGLSLGGEAPWFASNAGDTLAPTSSRQVEFGIKQELAGFDWSAALFQIHQAYQFARPNGDGSFTYVQQGQQKNSGLELSASGRVTSALQLSGSLAAIRSRVVNSGTDDYEGHQAINVPRLRASLQADYALAEVPGLSLLGAARYSGAKYADRDGAVEVGGYTVYDAGARFSTRIGDYPTVLRLSVDNLFDKRYWRDVGEYFGDGYLFQGAPRTARLTASVNF